MTTSPSTVQLYRYDLTNGMARTMAPMLIGRALEGVWHTSIVVFGKEFYFDGGVGIVADAHPGHTRFGTPYRTETLGTTRQSEAAFVAWCQARRQGVTTTTTTGGAVGGRFGPNDYNLLHNNCNHFSQAASQFLLGVDIPLDVRNMIPDLLSTPLGQMIRPTLEQMTSGPPGASMGGTGFPPASMAPAAAAAAAGGISSSSPLRGFPGASTASRDSGPATGSTEVCRGLLSPRTGLTPSEQEDADLLRVTLESNELIADGDSTGDGFDATLASLGLLRTAMEKIVAFPTEAKYRALSTASKTYTTKLKRLEPFGALDVLRLAGFSLRPHPSGTGGEQWYLSDAAGSKPVLEQLIRLLDEVIENVETSQAIAMSKAEGSTTKAASASSPSSSASPVDTAAPRASVSDLLRYASTPFPAGYEPLAVGAEGGQPLFSTLVTPAQSRESGLCMGKCHLTTGGDKKVHAQICAMNGTEKNVTGALSVLCVRAGDEKAAAGEVTAPLAWVPAPLLRAALREDSTQGAAESIFRAHGRFGVARAAFGAPGAIHPGVYEPSGRCVVPYGGKAQTVTESAQVLCYRALLPAPLRERVEALDVGDALLSAVSADRGTPWSSFAALRAWIAPDSPDTLSVTLPGASKPTRLARAVPLPLRQRHAATAAAVNTTTTSAAAGSHTQKRVREEVTSDTTARPREDRTHLLVCHDMQGGYRPGDYPHFALQESGQEGTNGTSPTAAHVRSRPSIAAVENAYTVSYWQIMDVFVYFSHQRVSVPPSEWVEAGHRRGVPVLGTIITEGAGGAAELNALLGDAKIMGETINKLVDLCVTYGFDGYLLNIENSLGSASQVKRLQLFTKMLRAKLQAALPENSGLVVWYDAVTVDGALTYQNALTPKNKPFMDVCDAIFTNYFWNPMHLALSKAAAAGRDRDVFVGVDVFGRGMYGGGQYNTYAAVREAAKSGLSVALFAPGWTAECEGHGDRETFLRAESRLWSRMQQDFAPHTVSPSVPDAALSPSPQQHPERAGFWTCFLSGVGSTFSVDGHTICPCKAASSSTACVGTGWCQLSAAHQEPAFEYLAPDDQIHQAAWSRQTHSSSSSHSPSTPLTAAHSPLQCRLVLLGDGGRAQGGAVTASWVSEPSRVWFGDRALHFLIPPAGTVKVVDVHERLVVSPAQTSGKQGHQALTLKVDIALLEDDDSGATSSPSPAVPPSSSRRVRLFYTLESTSVVSEAQAPSSPPFHATGSSRTTHTGYHQVDLAESDASQSTVVFERARDTQDAPGTWRVRRYTWQLPSAEALSETLGLARDSPSSVTVTVRAVALTNTCRDRSLRCHLGGLALHSARASPSPRQADNGDDSPLVLGAPKPLVDDAAGPLYRVHPSSSADVQVLTIPATCFTPPKNASHTGDRSAPMEVAVFGEMTKNGQEGETATLFLGVQRVPVSITSVADAPVLVIPVRAPADWRVKSVYYYSYSLPF